MQPERTVPRLFRAIVLRRTYVIAAALSVLALAAAAAATVQINYEAESFLPTWNEHRKIYDRYRATFPKQDLQVSLFYRPVGPLDVRGYQLLARAAKALERAGLGEVTWLGNVDVVENTVVEGDASLAVHGLLSERELSTASLASTLARYRSDALYVGRIWNRDQSVFALHGYLDAALNDPTGRALLEAALTAQLAPLRAEGHELVLSGLPVIKAQGLELVNTDTARFIGGGVLAIAVLLSLVFRNAWHVALTLMAVMPGYVVTLGVMGLTDTRISVLTSFIPVVVLVVGVCDAMHVLVNFRELRKIGTTSAEAVVHTYAELSSSCFYTAVATTLGFLSLMFTGIEAVVEFAFFTGLAVMATWCFTMTLMPALLSFSVAPPAREARWALWLVDGLVELARRVARRRRPAIMVGMLAIAAVGGILGLGLKTHAYLLDDIDPQHPLMRDVHWVEDHGFAIYGLNVWIEAKDGQSLSAPAMLAWMQRTQRELEREKAVIQTLSLADLVSQVRHAVVPEDARDTLPKSHAESAQLLLLAELGRQGFAADVYREGQSRAQIMTAVHDLGSSEMLPLLKRMDGYLVQHPPPGATASVTGTLRLTEDAFEDLLGGFGFSFFDALLSIFVLMVWMFRSVRQGLWALVPNVVPLLVLLGVMRIGGFHLKPSTLLVFSVALGFAVDDTVHLLGRVRDFLRAGHDVPTAIDESLRTSGRAVVMTSIVISTGFSILLFSQFKFLFLVGLLTLVCIAVAMLSDLFLYPQLLRFTLPTSAQRQSAATPIASPTTSGVSNHD